MNEHTISTVQKSLLAIRELKARNLELHNQLHEPIAIIGNACRLPGGVETSEQFWQLLLDGTDAISAIPSDRWDVESYFNPDPSIQGKMYTNQGGFLNDIAGFDCELFDVTAEEAQDMDPQHRILLELCWQAMENAGIAPKRLEQSHRSIGTFVGLATHDYSRAHIDSGNAMNIGRHAFTGAAFSVASGRIAYLLGLHGPTMTIDTACSSSLVALHSACQSLRNQECDQALACGMNILADPHKYVYFCKTAALSPSGRCHTFDANADGYVRAEGGAVVVLKRLSDAIAHNDNILAVIKGSGVNHDGRSNGLTAPSGPSQQRLIEQVWRKAGVSSNEVEFIECHGTGTPLGDPIEVNALGQVLEKGRQSGDKPCLLGASKSNIGHLEAAAGIVGLLKAAMVAKTGLVPPNLHLKNPNPYIDWEHLPVALPDGLTSLDEHSKSVKRRRVAAVSGFGFGGTNAHVVLENYVAENHTEQWQGYIPSIILLSACTASALKTQAIALIEFMQHLPQEKQTEMVLKRLAYTTQVGRCALPYRFAVVAKSFQACQSAISQFVSGGLSQQHAFTGTVGSDGVWYNTAEHSNNISEENLAQFWAQTGDIKWQSLHHFDKPPGVLALPTYPFERKTYWKRLGDATNGINAEPSGAEEAVQPSLDDASHTTAVPVIEKIKERFALKACVPISAVEDTAGPGELSIDSINLVQLRFELEQLLGTKISMQTIASADSWNEFVAAINVTETTLVDSGAGQAASISIVQPEQDDVPVESTKELIGIEHKFPLTDLQEAYLLGREIEPEESAVGCHLYFEFEIEQLDHFALNQSWNRLVTLHPMLRAGLTIDGQQYIREAENYSIVRHELQSAEQEQVSKHIHNVRQRLSHKVYSDQNWPMYSIEVTSMDKDRHRIHVSIDELIVDGTSVSLILRQWQALYLSPSEQVQVSDISFRQHVYIQQQRLRAQQSKVDLDYWLQKFTPFPAAPLLPAPTGKEPGFRSFQGKKERKRLKACLPPEEWQGFLQKSQQFGVSATVLMLAAFCDVLNAFTGSNRATTLVMTMFNRISNLKDMESLVGPVASSSLFKTPSDETLGLEALCALIQEQIWQDLDHASVGGVTVLRHLRRGRHIANDQILPVVFTSMVDNYKISDFEQNWSSDWIYAVTQTPQVHLDHQASVKYGALHFSWDIAVGYVDETAMQVLFNAYHKALTCIATKTSVQRHDVCETIQNTLLNSDMNSLRIAPQPIKEEPQEPFALTDMQSAYLFTRMLGEADAACIVYQDFLLKELDVVSFEEVVNRTIQRHPMLRAMVTSEGNQYFQQTVPRYIVKFNAFDSSGQEELMLRELRDKMLNQVFMPDAWPLFDIQTSRGSDGYRVHIAIDMLISDAPGIYQIYQELFKGYLNREVDTPRELFCDYLPALKTTLTPLNTKAGDAYWANRFAGLPSGPQLLPAKYPYKRRRLQYHLDSLPALRLFAKHYGVNLQDVMFTLYMDVLQQWCGDGFSVVMVDFIKPSGRLFDNCVGDFSWLSWIAVNSDRSLSFIERVRAYADLYEMDCKQFPVSGLRELRKRSAGDGSLLFPVVFSRLMENCDFDLPDNIQWDYGLGCTPQVCLDNVSVEQKGKLHIHWDVLDSAFENGVVETLLNKYVKELELLAESKVHWEARQVNQTSQL